MRVPQSPHNLRKFVSTSSDSDSETNSDSSNNNHGEKRPPMMPFNKKKDLRPTENYSNFSHRSRERTRISAVQRLVERKLAQKEKDREKERENFFRRSSSVGSSVANQDLTSLNLCNSEKSHLSRSLSRDRLNNENTKTYITISSGKPTRIRESSPSKRNSPETEKRPNSYNNADDILNKYCSPLKSTEIFKDLTSEVNKKEENVEISDEKPTRKISFTTEKTIIINDDNAARKPVDNPKMRKVSIDINYVYEQQEQVILIKGFDLSADFSAGKICGLVAYMNFRSPFIFKERNENIRLSGNCWPLIVYGKSILNKTEIFSRQDPIFPWCEPLDEPLKNWVKP